MARKVDPKTDQAPAAKPAAGADDLSILAPDDEVTIGGKKIVVQEYRFFDSLRVQSDEQPWFDALYQMLSEAKRPPTFDDVLGLVAAHADAVERMVALSTGQTVEWVKNLSESDGDRLLLAWWQVHSDFFVRRVMRRALQKRLEGSGSDGLGSSTS